MLKIQSENLKLDEKIYLDECRESWLEISKIDEDLKNYGNHYFEKLFDTVRQGEKSSVMVFNKDEKNPDWIEEKCSRWYKSYMETPEFRKDSHKSYMFCGVDGSEKEESLPKIFDNYLDFMKKRDFRYNQVVVNCYESEADYIPFHRDWVDGMVENYEISIISLTDLEDNHENLRKFEIVARDDLENDNIFDKIEVELINGLMITMGGKFQEKFRHGVPKISEDREKQNRRIGITFRQFLSKN